jgi:hypothetical protein
MQRGSGGDGLSGCRVVTIPEGLARLDRGVRATDVEPVRRYQRDRLGELVMST